MHSWLETVFTVVDQPFKHFQKKDEFLFKGRSQEKK